MIDQTRILAFAGSLRARSYNKVILRLAAEEVRIAAAEVTVIDLEDYPLPLFNPDEYETRGLHPNALEFQRMLATHDGLLIATPEYNGSFPAVLKNVFEWATRKSPTYERRDMFPGKSVGLISSSPGQLGGVKALMHLRSVLSGLGMKVLGEEVVIPFVDQKLVSESNSRDELTLDSKVSASLANLANALVFQVKAFQSAQTE